MSELRERQPLSFHFFFLSLSKNSLWCFARFLSLACDLSCCRPGPLSISSRQENETKKSDKRSSFQIISIESIKAMTIDEAAPAPAPAAPAPPPPTRDAAAPLTDAEAALYDRQLRVWGVEAQKR